MIKVLTIVLIGLLIMFFVLVNLQTIRQMKEIEYWEMNSEWWWGGKDDIVTIVQYNPDSDYIVFETFNYHVRYKVKRQVFNKMVERGEMVQYNHEK